ncbi:putative orfan [Tupanvirus soda lake]|uniref:Orfan n=2 Tax=Tupanvirus TaxID=2094720 RepID=A0AC62ACF4_9VIRU|nr:putative orfan [Tupanvirus soda lake]QKU35367.1 putative orfan [Tupanvirus soda lake]
MYLIVIFSPANKNPYKATNIIDNILTSVYIRVVPYFFTNDMYTKKIIKLATSDKYTYINSFSFSLIYILTNIGGSADNNAAINTVKQLSITR